MIIITKNKTVIRNKVSCSTFILIITNTHPSLRRYSVRLDKMFISHVQPTNVCLRVPLNYENDLKTEVSCEVEQLIVLYFYMPQTILDAISMPVYKTSPSRK